MFLLLQLHPANGNFTALNEDLVSLPIAGQIDSRYCDCAEGNSLGKVGMIRFALVSGAVNEAIKPAGRP